MFRWLLASTCLLTSAAGLAQGIAPPDPAGTADGAGGAGISDIVVTASRRAENVQRSALSIQAITSEQLSRRGISRPEDLNVIAPGVSVATGGNYPQTYIRGVGNYASNSYAEGAVAYNIDGVYVSRSWATRAALFDLERVEVLKGPQGTLYGRNASGGAINFITARPKLGQTGGFAELEAGNYDLKRGSAAVNLPIGDTAALRASGQITHRDGYLTDGYDDDKSQSARLHLLWEPSRDLSLLLTGGYQHVGGKGAASVVNPKLPGTRWRGPSDPAVRAIVGAQPGIGPLLVDAGFRNDGFLDIDVYSISGEVNWRLGDFATLTVLPAYREATLRDRSYVPGFQANDDERDKQSSLEVRLGGDGDFLKWVVGGFYFDEEQSDIDGRNLLILQGVSAQRTQEFDSKIRSYAGFGQATASVTDTFRLTGGIRYTYERKRLAGVTSSFSFPANPPAAPCGAGTSFDAASPSPPLFCRRDVPLGGELTFNSWTWKAGAEYDIGPASMFYANASTGFKSGGFYGAPAPNTFRPEKLTAFDAGIKNRFFDNRLQLNLEAFYWLYDDHQESYLGPTSIPGFFTFITTNAGKAKSYGADVDILVRPSSADTFNLKVQYNKSRYDSFVRQNPTAAFGPPVTGCPVGPLIAGQQAVDCSGFQLVRTPTWTGTAGYSHAFELPRGDRIAASVNGQFASSSFLSIDFLETARQGGYATVDADLSYTTPDRRLTVTGYVRNITNQDVLTQGLRYPFANPATNPAIDDLGLIMAAIRPPRTYGVRARYDF
ncbi:MAG: TonB-dependent receptor [Sphingomonas fennica]